MDLPKQTSILHWFIDQMNSHVGKDDRATSKLVQWTSVVCHTRCRSKWLSQVEEKNISSYLVLKYFCKLYIFKDNVYPSHQFNNMGPYIPLKCCSCEFFQSTLYGLKTKATGGVTNSPAINLRGSQFLMTRSNSSIYTPLRGILSRVLQTQYIKNRTTNYKIGNNKKYI